MNPIPHWTYPLHIRQMMADQNSAPQIDGERRIQEAKIDWVLSMNPEDLKEWNNG